MENIRVESIPDKYKKAVSKEFQGRIVEVSYDVNNYINKSRQLVTDQNISREKAGREIVEGGAITKKCNIYLPSGYDESDRETKYNVLYLLHGVGGNRFEWLDGSGKTGGNYVICNMIDNLIASGDIEPLIVVFPNGRSAYDWADTSFNSEGTNMLGFYYFDYELRYDLIPFVESNYNIYANIENQSLKEIDYNRRHRSIAGLSMGGMQSLNLTFGGYRYDSTKYNKAETSLGNGLAKTIIKTPGMEDLFAYVGAFSNAPTTSDGEVLGTAIASSEYIMDLLYITCGKEDEIARRDGYEKAIDGLIENAGNNLFGYYQVLIEGGVHDFNVWNNGAYNFLRLSFQKREEKEKQNIVRKEI